MCSGIAANWPPGMNWAFWFSSILCDKNHSNSNLFRPWPANSAISFVHLTTRQVLWQIGQVLPVNRSTEGHQRLARRGVKVFFAFIQRLLQDCSFAKSSLVRKSFSLPGINLRLYCGHTLRNTDICTLSNGVSFSDDFIVCVIAGINLYFTHFVISCK